jgi:hypothetical protein
VSSATLCTHAGVSGRLWSMDDVVVVIEETETINPGALMIG